MFRRVFAFVLFVASVVASAPSAPHAAEPANRCYLADPSLAPAARATEVNVRSLGERALWIPAPGVSFDDFGAEELRAAEGERLVLVGPRGQADHRLEGRVLARWSNYSVIAVPVAQFHAEVAHCYEEIRYVAPAPRPVRTSEFGTRARTPLDAALKAQLVDAVNLDRYTQILRELCGDLPVTFDEVPRNIRNRNTYSGSEPGDIEDAQRYIREHFEAAGYTVIEQVFNVFSEPTKNIVAVKPGFGTSNEIVVIGAHYDSISEAITVTAPGSEDNASGTAAVLHLAEVFADYETDRTIHFVAFGGEEQGLKGSYHYVDQLATNGWIVTNALTMDMISAWSVNYELLVEGTPNTIPLIELVEANAASFGGIATNRSTNSFGSDHVPFQQAGIPAILAIDEDWELYADYHRTTDTFDKVDPQLGFDIVRTIAASAVDLVGSIDGVGVDDPRTPPGPAVRHRLRLDTAHPNPFNPRTEIAFSIPRSGPTRLTVYDARGRAVRTLVNTTREAGAFQVTWDGSDDEGRPLASGVYLYRLVHADGIRSQRMVLVR